MAKKRKRSKRRGLRSLNPVPKAEALAHRYLQNPGVRALVQLVPFGVGSALETYLATRLDNIRQRRRQTFFDELAKGTVDLTPQLIENEDFLHCFVATVRAVDRTRREEKIHMFARLLSAASSGGAAPDADEYEELLGIVDQLTPNEFRVLLALEEYEATYYKDGQFHGDGRDGVLHPIAAKHLGVPQDQLTDDELRAIVMRLNRVGCYGLFGWRQGPAKDCSLTPVYRRLKDLVADKDGTFL
jgi:hypothetical protein